MEIKAVIFDMDGVLFDTEKLMKEGWMKAGREMGFTITENHLRQMRGSSRDQSAALFQKWEKFIFAIEQRDIIFLSLLLFNLTGSRINSLVIFSPL